MRPRRHPYTVLDVFTSTPLEGNALAVVHDADGVDDATMQRFARETRLAETCFVQSPSIEGADYRNRIWTIAHEVPFAGHPSLGTAVAVARSRGEAEARYVQQTIAGLQPVDVRLEGDGAVASVLQEPARFGAVVDAAAIMVAVGLEPEDADPELPAQLVSTGLPTLLAPVRSKAAVARAKPDFERVAAVLADGDAENLYVVWCEVAGDRARAHARMFTEMAAGGEDPATGSAAAPLCAYLAERRDCPRVEVTQGVEMGRPSRLRAELEGDRVRVSGDVVVVVEGSVALEVPARTGPRTRSIERDPPGGRAAAFFDLDRTLIAGSSAYAFGRASYKLGQLSRRQIARDAVNQVRFRLRGSTDDAVNALLARVMSGIKGRRVTDLARMRADILAGILPRVYPQMMALVRDHQDAGRPCYIVTAASHEMVQVLAMVLAMDGGIGTPSEVRDGVYTGELAGPFAYGEGKARALREFAAAEAIDLSASWAYSDSASDLPMLRAVGHPVAVNPDAELAEAARRDGWEVLRFEKLGQRLRITGTVLVAAAVGGSGSWIAARRRSPSAQGKRARIAASTRTRLAPWR